LDWTTKTLNSGGHLKKKKIVQQQRHLKRQMHLEKIGQAIGRCKEKINWWYQNYQAQGTASK
jgi:hypothetical protein